MKAATPPTERVAANKHAKNKQKREAQAGLPSDLNGHGTEPPSGPH
jgi:hypothetical protein